MRGIKRVHTHGLYKEVGSQAVHLHLSILVNMAVWNEDVEGQLDPKEISETISGFPF